MFKLSITSRTKLSGVDPELIAIVNLALKISKVDFGIPVHGGIRTKEEQNQLFRDKKSKADGYVKESRHQSGEAVDFYAYVDGKASWHEDHLAMVACAFLQSAAILKIPVNWGGLWKSNKTTNGIPYGWDMAHIELQ